MAANLRAKLPETDEVIVNDRDSEALERFKNEINTASAGKPKKVEAFDSARAVAERSVSKALLCHPNGEQDHQPLGSQLGGLQNTFGTV
jgi:hypothetical protein